MKPLLRFALGLPAAVLFITTASAQVPQMINYQGRVQSGGTNFNGTGKFKFAILVGNSGSFWSNDGTSSQGSEPTKAVSILVVNGAYSVLLGDTTVPNMTSGIDPINFTTSNNVRLRVWFDDGVHGSQLLMPDQRIAAVGWAMVAGTVVANGVTNSSLAAGAVTAAKIANNTITGTQLANGAVGTSQLAANSVTASQIAANTITASKIAANTITASQIANDTITGTQIAAGGISEPELAVNSVTFTQLANNSVHSVTLQDAAVTNAKIANGAIDVSKFGITATTKITNLNADLLDGIDSTAFVLKAGDTMTGRLLMNSSGYLDVETSAATAVTGFTSATNGTGVYGQADNGTNAWGVYGTSASGLGVYGASASGYAGYFDGKVQINGVATVQVLTITGGSDLAEPFNISKRNIPKGSVVVIDDSAPGNLTLSNKPYDHRVAGIVSGANGVQPGIQLHQEGVMDGDENVALSGRVYVSADTSNGAIKPGDLLTTSRVPGHAMRVTNHAKARGAIIGKAMSALDRGDGMVLVLVSLE